MKVYFDNAATTKLHPKVLEKMLPYLDSFFGNPSSIHSYGRKAKVAIEESRELIADFINADPSEIYFTSSGTEANNFIINGIAKTEKKESNKNHLITSQGDHKAVINTINNLTKQNFTTSKIDITNSYNYNYDRLVNSISENTSLLSLIHVNNETGTINDINKLNSFAESCYLHSDTVQSFGKIDLDVKKLGIHALSASAHKLYGPKGIGLAYVKSGTPLDSFIIGGGQEKNRRAGTENVASIVGFAEAVKLAKQEMITNFEIVSKLKKHFIAQVEAIEGIIQNSTVNSSPYILSITINPELYNNDSEAILMYLDINGIAASSGSACASGTVKPSHVILAGGYSDSYANGTIRFSFSANNTIDEIDYTVSHIENLLKKLKK